VLPSLTAAAAGTLPPSRLATGIAVQTTGRQIGSALGIAILVPVLGAGANFEGAWADHHRGHRRGPHDLSARTRGGVRAAAPAPAETRA
jgi:hypothetical protein